MLKQWRDNFQLGGKDKLNLKLTVFLRHVKAGRSSQRFGSFKSRDSICQNIWNLKRVWITPKSLSDFRAYRKRALFFTYDN